ncbi:hypothetical protein PPACK8108_LOCUS11901 [Phakopsora pachyrhizi]|uniref:Uncharacterized protein n=1 Tax=Phakopsora pachyrhizi TaxID=170000 RepID=A0AAV0B2F9_PHAPC|nr:hypothetical protein PPACK8108_LOCUS11901 [Phakopsora pachyrhizi]
MSLSCSSADGVKLIQKFEIPKLGNLRVSLKSDSTIGILQSSSERPYQEDRTMAGNLHLQSSGLIKSISGQPLVDQGNLISRSKSSIIDGHGGSEASGFLSANLPRLEEEWIKISDLNGRFERLMVVAVLGFGSISRPHWLSLGSSSSAQSKEGATDDCSWVRDKSFPDDVIETNGSATAFQGKTRGKRKGDLCLLDSFKGSASNGPTVRDFKPSHRKIKPSENRQVMRGDDDNNRIWRCGIYWTRGSNWSSWFNQNQIKETRDLSNQKEDEFEDKKTLNRHMLLFGLPDQELQKGGPNKNWKSTTDCLKERMDGSDLHPTETSDDSKQEVVVEFDDKLVPIVSQKAFKKLHTLLKKH